MSFLRLLVSVWKTLTLTPTHSLESVCLLPSPAELFCVHVHFRGQSARSFFQALHPEADALHLRAPLPLQHYTRLVLGLGIARKESAQVGRHSNHT